MTDRVLGSHAVSERGHDLSSWWLRRLLAVLSPAGARGRLTIFMYHRVHPRPDAMFPNEMHADLFEERMSWIKSAFNVLPLSEAVSAIRRGSLPSRAASITFDDGYGDNCAIAFPILHRQGLPATFFIATGYLDGGCMFNDIVIESIRGFGGDTLDLAELNLGSYPTASMQERRSAATQILARIKYLPAVERKALAEGVALRCGTSTPDDLMMTRRQVRDLASAGMEVGVHTVTHPILTSIDAASVRHEFAASRETLEEVTAGSVTLLAYPNGKPDVDYGLEHVRMVQDMGFSAAVTTAPGAARVSDSVFELPRFTPWDRTRTQWGLRLARNYRVAVATATR